MIKILATIGPASEDEGTISEFALNTKLFRLNGSHGELDWHRHAIKSIRSVCPDAFILLDIPGVKPRTANTKDIFINEEQEVIFGLPEQADSRLSIPLTKPLPSWEAEIKTFSVNDGQFIFDVIDFGLGYVIGRSHSEFTLLPQKGINLPGSIYNESQQFDVYQSFIKNIDGMDINGLGLSFVQTGEIINEVRRAVPHLVLVSKIENSEGLRNCEDIISASDAIMIDRGDLAAEIGLSDLYNAIEVISANTKAAGKPLIMATENLESMISRQTPSKSEVMSIAHSISIGADCIMLSEETATASNGSNIVNWLAQYLAGTKPFKKPNTKRLPNKKFPEIWQLVEQMDDMPVLLMTKSGYALFDYIAMKPNARVTIVANNKKVIETSKLLSNEVTIIQTPVNDNTPIETIWEVVEKHKDIFFNEADKIAAIYVSKYVKGARANSITIFDKNDFFTQN